MSLNLTPVSSPHEKPLPPSRSKRISNVDARSPLRHQEDGPLCERSHEDLLRMPRDELLQAIREHWDERDRLRIRLIEMEENEDRCRNEKDDLSRTLQGLQDRLNTVYSEQGKLEADVEARDELLDRLRSKLAMVERDLRETQNRASTQEKAFEYERAAAQAQEAHLNTRIRQLQSASASSSKLAQPASAPSETLQEDLDSLRVSHHHLLSQLDSLSAELQESRQENTRLKEENEGWEYLVRERTFQGHLFQTDEDGGGRHLEALDEELESEMKDLHTELDIHSPPLDVDGRTLSRTSTIGLGRAARRPGREAESRQLSVSGLSEVTDEPKQGMDLAAELGRAEPSGNISAPASRVVSSAAHAVTHDESEVQVENKRLKEEVKALQLYCSKIIDRIIAQDAFEHILSVDYKTRKMGRSTSGRGSLQSVMQMMHTPNATQEPTTPSVEKSERRARRGFSLDLRSFGFGASSTPSASTGTKAPLRPLALAPAAAARKLEPQAEDEEDRRERHRLDAALKLMGIDKPDSTANAAGQTQVNAKADTPTLPPPVRRSSSIKSGTPLSRLSSALGFTDTSAQLPADPDPSPEKVDAALRDYDAKEQARRRSLSKGQAEGGYTSPPRMASLRRHTDLDISAAGHDHKSKGSISSLWSTVSGSDQHQE